MVTRLIDYFYTGKYCALQTAPEQEQPDAVDALAGMLIHVRMFALADQYLITGLGKFSDTEYFRSIFQTGSIPRIALLTVPEIYSSTPASARGLRERVAALSTAFLPDSLAKEDVKKLYEDVAASTPEFVKDFLDDFLLISTRGTEKSAAAKRALARLSNSDICNSD